MRSLTCGPSQFEMPRTRSEEIVVSHNLDQQEVNRGDPGAGTAHTHSATVGGNRESSWRTHVSRLNTTLGLNDSVSLTKEQRANRKSLNTELPPFNGDPSQWVTFITLYAQTTDACGFTDSENKVRLEKCLSGDAKLLVRDKLQHPRHVEDVMRRLEQAFGQSAVLLSGMHKRVDKMDALEGDLSNLAAFLGEVEAVQDVFNVTGKDSSGSELLRNIELLLPIQYAREWNRLKRENGHNLSGLVIYLNTLFDEAIEIGVSVIKKNSAQRGRTTDPQPTRRLLLMSAEKCPLGCETGHELHECPQFLEADSRARWNTVKNFNKCRMCLGPHFLKTCTLRQRCGIDGCPGQHHKLLHFAKPGANRAGANYLQQRSPEQATRNMMTQSKHTQIHSRIVPVNLTCDSVTVQTWAVWDAGSEVTLINTELAKKLNLRGERSVLTLQWTNEATVQNVESERVTLVIAPIEGGERFEITAQTMDNLSPPQGTVTAEVVDEEEFDVPVTVNNNCHPEILIGQDNAVVMRTLRSVLGKSGQLVASETPFGWVVEGRVGELGAKRVLSITHQREPLDKLVAEFVENDNYGLVDEKDVLRESDRDMAARRKMQDDTVYKDGRYETGLLWVNRETVLPDNKGGALQRHLKFEEKLRRNPDLWARLNVLMDSYLAKNYIRPAAGEGTRGRTWYLPVFTVTNPAKPQKLRVVWDAAAKFHGVCLNDALMSGPDLTSPLVDILLRFRAGQYAVTGDIEEMFHRIVVQEQDRCAQRFFWRRSAEEPIAIYEMCVLIFGATCSPSLAQFAKNGNADRNEIGDPDTVFAIKNNHYVDDLLQSLDDEHQLAELIVNVRDVHASGGFKIHKWESNSTAVMDALDVQPPNRTGSREVSHFHTCSVLGMIWETTNDLFSFRLRGEKLCSGFLTGTAAPTKRTALSTVMSIYDPLGLLSYWTLELKLILREAWRQNVDWDEKLPTELTRRWNKWGRAAAELEKVSIPRWLGTTIRDAVEIHVFSDASENAIAAVAYVVQRSSGARMMCFSKSKVASVKAKSIPRLELDAATLGVRVLKIVLKAHPWRDVARVVMWTDARDVLFWIRSTERRYSAYVANRVSTILSSTSVENWRWVPTEENPADMATKECKDKASNLWWQGPSFLANDEEEWPNCFEKPVQELETRRVGLVRKSEPDAIVPDLKTSSISSWLRLIRATARVRLAAFILTKRTKSASEPTAEDEKWAEKRVISMIQRECNIESLKKFSPFMDEDGIWRARTRLMKGEFSEDVRSPIILADHAATRLLIQHYHHFGGHQNFFRTINEIRRRFIIPRLRSLANKVVKACRMCVVMNARPVIPEMAALPRCRLAVDHSAFAYTGVDCFGPIDVLKFRRHEKRWGMLFTCLTTRAVYIELVSSLSAAACVAAIESFVTRRSLPLQFRSDNGTNFVAAANLYRGPNGERPSWIFNPPGSPHFGGAWERLIGVTKRTLQKMDFTKIRTEEELRRALIKAEYIVNTRPMTEYPVDEDTLECLTPQHILEGRRTRDVPTKVLETDLDTFSASTAMAEREEIVQQFWDRWTREYLPSLQTRQKWFSKQECLKPGDVVYLCDTDVREGWRRGVVEKTYLDCESNQVRQLTVRAADGKIYRRGAARLAKIS